MPLPAPTVFDKELTDEQCVEYAGQFQSLIGHPSWNAFLSLVYGQKRAAQDAALESDVAQFDYWKGVVMGVEAPLASLTAIIRRGQLVDAKAERSGRLRRLHSAEGDPSY